MLNGNRLDETLRTKVLLFDESTLRTSVLLFVMNYELSTFQPINLSTEAPPLSTQTTLR